MQALPGLRWATGGECSGTAGAGIVEHCGSAAHTAGQLLPFPKAGTQSSNLLSWAEEHRTEGQGAGEGRNCLMLASGERRAGVIGSTSQPPGQEGLSRLGDPGCWGKTWYAVAMGLWHRGQSGKSSSSMMLPANYFICLDFPFFKMVMAILTQHSECTIKAVILWTAVKPAWSWSML